MQKISKSLKNVWTKYINKHRHFEYPHFETNWNSIALKLSEFGGISGGNKVLLYKNQDHVFEDMWKEIDNAKHSIRLETYIFEPDDIGKKFLHKLSNASKRGCEVVMLYDDFGSFSLSDVHIKELKDNGGDVIAFKPLKRSLKKWHNTKIMALLLGRNHRKVMVVDDKIAFCGGMNIGGDYCSPAIGGTGFFKDAHIKIEGPAVQDLVEVFEDSIKEANISYNALAEIIKMKFRGMQNKLVNKIPPNENFEETIVQVLQSNARANKKEIEKGFMIALESCVNSCVVTTPYFLPSKRMKDSLIRAAQRGIQIEIITAGRTDVLIAKFASRHIYSSFLKNGIKIYEMKNYALHAKMANIDDLYGYVGSFNMDLLSMNCNMETCLTFMSPDIAGQIKDKFDDYKNESTLISLEDMEKANYFRKTLNWTAFHFVRIYSIVFKTFGLGKRDHD